MHDDDNRYAVDESQEKIDSLLRQLKEQRCRLRDELAMAALTGLIINPMTCTTDVPISARAYELADAMLKTREGI
jgi:hypothetical protein